MSGAFILAFWSFSKVPLPAGSFVVHMWTAFFSKSYLPALKSWLSSNSPQHVLCVRNFRILFSASISFWGWAKCMYFRRSWNINCYFLLSHQQLQVMWYKSSCTLMLTFQDSILSSWSCLTLAVGMLEGTMFHLNWLITKKPMQT